MIQRFLAGPEDHPGLMEMLTMAWELQRAERSAQDIAKLPVQYSTVSLSVSVSAPCSLIKSSVVARVPVLLEPRRGWNLFLGPTTSHTSIARRPRTANQDRDQSQFEHQVLPGEEKGG